MSCITCHSALKKNFAVFSLVRVSNYIWLPVSILLYTSFILFKLICVFGVSQAIITCHLVHAIRACWDLKKQLFRLLFS